MCRIHNQLFFNDVTSKPKCRLFSFFCPLWRTLRGRLSEALGWWRGGGEEGRCRSCSRCTCTHYHPFTVCHLPFFYHSLSLLLPPTYSFLPRPSFLVVVVGVARYTTRSLVRETQSKTGTACPRCTDHSAPHPTHPLSSLSLSPRPPPLCRSLIRHLQFVPPHNPHQYPVFKPWNTHGALAPVHILHNYNSTRCLSPPLIQNFS